MMSKLVKLCFVFIALIGVSTYGATIAHWDFEEGTPGQVFNDFDGGAANGANGAVDTVNGYLMRGWDNYYGPSFTSSSIPGSNVAMSNADNHQDGYCTDADLTTWSPSVWTIECSIYLEEINGWETFIGRDGSSQSEPEADFYLVNNGIDDKFRVNFDTVGGTRWVLDGDYTVQTSYWYGLAVTSDGETLTMLLDDGSGFEVIGSMDISAQSVADNALAVTNFAWTFGRGWYNGGFVDHIDGMMDNIRFSDTVLAPEELIAVPEPTTVILLGIGGMILRRRR